MEAACKKIIEVTIFFIFKIGYHDIKFLNEVGHFPPCPWHPVIPAAQTGKSPAFGEKKEKPRIGALQVEIAKEPLSPHFFFDEPLLSRKVYINFFHIMQSISFHENLEID